MPKQRSDCAVILHVTARAFPVQCFHRKVQGGMSCCAWVVRHFVPRRDAGLSTAWQEAPGRRRRSRCTASAVATCRYLPGATCAASRSRSASTGNLRGVLGAGRCCSFLRLSSTHAGRLPARRAGRGVLQRVHGRDLFCPVARKLPLFANNPPVQRAILVCKPVLESDAGFVPAGEVGFFPPQQPVATRWTAFVGMARLRTAARFPDR